MTSTFLFTGCALLTATAGFGQNSVVISQSGGAGNQASVSQSGGGNQVSIDQQSADTSNGSKPGNRVSLRVLKGTQTTISQQSEGPNAVEISQDGQATAIIRQSSTTNENTISTLPDSQPVVPGAVRHQKRPTKRPHRRP